MTLAVVSKNSESGLTVVKRSNPFTGQTYEFQVHVPDDSYQKFHIEARFTEKWEADDHIKMNAETRQIWNEAA